MFTFLVSVQSISISLHPLGNVSAESSPAKKIGLNSYWRSHKDCSSKWS